MSIVALITARGGSKTLPNKNLLKIGKETLVSKAVFDAYESGKVDKVFISSDSDKIIDSAKTKGAICLSRRKKELAQDNSTDREVILDFMIELNRITEPQFLIHLRPTSPQRSPLLIKEVIQEFVKKANKNYTSIRTYHEVSGSPLKLALVNKDYEICPLGKEQFGNNIWGMPRQELPKLAQGNGLVDILKPEIIRNSKSHYGNKVLGYKTARVIDIDTRQDYEAVRKLIS